jgi:uroporphyrin-III C-methyltransferase/precorrin-2 dehydrogenase/sirohydrochlorin ferrochelatase
MISSLPLFHRIAGRPVIVLGSGDTAEARRRLVERARGVVVDDLDEGIARGARLAFIAHDDPVHAAADVAHLREAGLLVNAADRPELCDFTVPSLLDRSPVLVAIGTGGASAGLAKALRLRLEALLPLALGALAERLHSARGELRARWPAAGDRRRAIDTALAEGGALDPLRDVSVAAVEGWLAGAANGGESGATEIVLRSPDPDDLTLREARLLGGADVIAYEPGVPQLVLDRARADAVRVVLSRGQSLPDRPGLVVVLRLGGPSSR